jgi:hypothetical protein
MNVNSLLRSWHAALATSVVLFGLFVAAPADSEAAAPPTDHFPIAAKSAAQNNSAAQKAAAKRAAATKQAKGQKNQSALGRTAKKDKKHHKHHKKQQKGQRKGPTTPTTNSSNSGGVAQGQRTAATSNRNQQAGSRDASKLRRVLK